MILVVGASGQLGARIVRGLLDRGTQVRGLARSAPAEAELRAAGADAVRGDLRDRGSLDRACEGVHAVITTANSARRSGDDSIANVDDAGTHALIDAARAAGARQFVYTSVLGATADSPVPFLAAKGANESRLRASGMNWTILAPNMFMESWPMRVVGIPARAGQPVVIVGEGRRRHAFVAEADVAAFAVAAVNDDRAMGRRIPIGGPEALSWRDVVQMYERVLGRTIELRSARPGDAIPGVPPAVLPLLAATDTYDSEFDTTGDARMFGVRLTPLEELIRSS